MVTNNKMGKVSVTHLKGTSGFDKRIKKKHMDNCSCIKCPNCELYYKRNNLTKIPAHVLYNNQAWIVTTCLNCNSRRDQIAFKVDMKNMTFITSDLTKYRKRENGQK